MHRYVVAAPQQLVEFHDGDPDFPHTFRPDDGIVPEHLHLERLHEPGEAGPDAAEPDDAEGPGGHVAGEKVEALVPAAFADDRVRLRQAFDDGHQDGQRPLGHGEPAYRRIHEGNPAGGGSFDVDGVVPGAGPPDHAQLGSGLYDPGRDPDLHSPADDADGAAQRGGQGLLVGGVFHGSYCLQDIDRLGADRAGGQDPFS